MSTPVVQTELSREERHKLALTYVHEHGSITNKEYRTITGVSGNTALRDLDAPIVQGSLRATGQKRNRRYML
ncbi:MAG: hypothetical protein NVSMB38_39750 [Ktedonobacteraceae bacterium]